MRTGKISENILKRSVLRQIEHQDVAVIKGAGVGEDCAFLSWGKEQSMTALSTQTITLPVKNPAFFAILAAANNLAAQGAVPRAVALAITLPEGAEEALLKEIMYQAEACAQKLQLRIVGGHTEVSKGVRWPIVTATAAGAVQELHQGDGCQEAGASDLAVVVSKWIGMEGTAMIAGEKEAELLKRYPASLIALAKEQAESLSVASEAATALKSGVYAMHDVRNGGIFGALWEISRKLGVGLSIDLKAIPVRQETIEVCEFYQINPYELLSGGMLIMLHRDGNRLVKELEEQGISAAMIGTTHAGNDKIVRNQEETRYLEPPAADEIYKLSFI